MVSLGSGFHEFFKKSGYKFHKICAEDPNNWFITYGIEGMGSPANQTPNRAATSQNVNP